MSDPVRIYHSIAELPAGARPMALTIGNFDGVHRGHRQILRRVAEVARENGWRSAVLTFDPHPAQLVAPTRAPRLMTSPRDRCRYMGEEGIEQVIILPFTHELAGMSPRAFASHILVDGLDARSIFVGDNFRFGHKQAGDTALLRQLGEEMGFETHVLHGIFARGSMVSSTRIRELLLRGAVAQAGRLLTRPFAIEGEVVRGHGVGSKQTVPTLNLRPGDGLLPSDGVYVSRAADLDNGREWEAITNIGMRPTFDGDERTIETFLLEPLGAQPARIRVELLRWVRGERKFETPEALRSQILRDVARAQAYHRRVKRWTARAAEPSGVRG